MVYYRIVHHSLFYHSIVEINVYMMQPTSNIEKGNIKVNTPT